MNLSFLSIEIDFIIYYYLYLFIIYIVQLLHVGSCTRVTKHSRLRREICEGIRYNYKSYSLIVLHVFCWQVFEMYSFQKEKEQKNFRFLGNFYKAVTL